MDGIRGRRPSPVGVGMEGTPPGDGRAQPVAGGNGQVRSPVPAHRIVPPLGHTPLSPATPEVRAIGPAGRSSVERMAKPATAQQVREVVPPLESAWPGTERS